METPSEPVSVLDIFKIGVGPSSSHTLGPWRAALRFLDVLGERAAQVRELKVHLFGSLAKTGKGHGTDVALLLGLGGEDPVTIDVESIPSRVKRIREDRTLLLAGRRAVPFDPAADLLFHYDQMLPYHPNGLRFSCAFSGGSASDGNASDGNALGGGIPRGNASAGTAPAGETLEETYYSIGGGFVVQEGGSLSGKEMRPAPPYPSENAAGLLAHCESTGNSISALVLENEKAWRPEKKTREAVGAIWEVMRTCMYRGCHIEGVLPGGLQVLRRASLLNKRLIDRPDYPRNYEGWTEAIRSGGDDFAYILDWVSCFALAVNEENASFGRVVTAPTNGAAGVIPAVLQYLVTFTSRHQSTLAYRGEELVLHFLLCASEIGSLFKKKATLSAAMGGCQAEIGVSSAMAAAALTESLGGNVKQCLMAAEIAMEHHLGLTCDPIGGLVQVPCIERNTMGAIKAITASQLALNSDPDQARVSLDAVIKTMWETALDMNSKYKETSEGGLAVNIPISLSEC